MKTLLLQVECILNNSIEKSEILSIQIPKAIEEDGKDTSEETKNLVINLRDHHSKIKTLTRIKKILKEVVV